MRSIPTKGRVCPRGRLEATGLSILALCFVSSAAFAQPAVVEYGNDFQSFTAQSNVPGWVDTPVGASRPDAKGLFKTWPDPLVAANVVYGTKQSSGRPEGRNPRIGAFSTLTDRTFAGKGRFEYRGRILRTDSDGRIGVSFFSSYPEADRYYLIGLWSQESTPALTMQLFAFGGGAPAGKLDSGFTPAPGQWTRFLIQVDDVDGETRIRARFWLDGSSEPGSFSIDARDTEGSRLTAGRIGIWASVKGEAYADDLHAKSPIDTTPPAIAFTDPDDGAVISTPVVRVSGTADDAVSVTVNGLPAGIDPQNRTFLSPEIRLLEGENAISAVGVDDVGNRATIVLHLTLDTRAPEIAVATPAAGACLDVAALALAGTVVEPHLQALRVRAGDAVVDAAIDSGARTWAASLPAAEGAQTVVVEGIDVLGHRRVVPRSVLIDRTAPAVEIVNGDRPAADGDVANRPMSFYVTVRDLDRAPGVQVRLGAEPYVEGTPVSAEGTHTLSVIATDCAGHRTERALSFTIDTTSPQFESLTPAHGARVGSAPSAITGTVSADVVSIGVAGTAAAATPENGRFTIAGVPFLEGENRFVLRAVDRAGNVAETDYVITVATGAPTIEILESDAPIADGALFSREVHPRIRVSDPEASVVATINGAPFTAGTALGTDGAYTLAATATDDLGHSTSRQVAFTIDRTAPLVSVSAPLPGRVAGESVLVQGTAGDSISATVNGIPAVLAGEAFSATVPIEEGENVLVAAGTDAAGNTGRAEVVVTRDSRASGVLITAPADGFVTNRASVRIAGRVLDPGTIASVSIGGAPVPVDASGAFDLQIALALGENVITAVATSKSGGSTSATVRVVADRTAPGLRILESGRPLADQARFPAGAALALDVSDDRALGAAVARLDGREIALPAIVSAAGGHAIVAVAVDAAGNEARVERTFFVGAAGSAGGCRLDSFVPASGSVVALATTGLTGRTGGAAGVKVNGIPASVANGSFCATVELPSEGANPIEIVCTDAGGTRVGEPARLTLVRSTAAPSVSITVPAEGAWSDKASIAVSGTSGAGVVEVTVNGERAAIGEGDPNAPRPFSVDGIRLVPGLNVILVRATTASGRSVLAARRVFYLNEPPSVTITSPLPAQQIGSAPLLLSGLWSGIDPATLVAAGSAAVPEIAWTGDRSGTFLFRDLPLGPGEQTVAVSGRDVLGRVANATVLVTRDDLAPSIQITEPRDHAIFAAARPAIETGGTAIAASGATVEVNGQRASIVSTEPLGGARVRYSFTASVPFATLGPTPLVARVTEPAGRGAYHAIRVDRLAAAPKVERVFPANAAIGIDPGAMIVVLFSSPMDRGSLRCGAGDGCAFRLEASNGSPVSGLLDLDGDAMTFAPAAPLEDGTEYTIRVTTAARDAAGGPIGSEHASRFRVGLAAAQASAPALDAFPAKHCGTMLPITGSAPAGARVRLDVGSSAFTVTADASGRFAYDAPLTGESGFLLVRARTIASSGALSAASHSCVLVDCGGLGVASAAYDRTVNTLTITFSAPVDVATATGGAIRLVADGVAIAATIALESPSVLRVSPVEDLTRLSFTLEITTAVRALDGRPLSAPFAQPFPFDSGEPAPGDGTGFVSGEIYDASTGRSLAGARVAVLPSTMNPVLADHRGRYTVRLPEGVHTLHVAAPGYTEVWRQLVVRAGAGVAPIDIRLAHRAGPATVAALPLALTDGGDAVAARATLEIPAGGVQTGSTIAFTSVGAQSLAGLLPIGWSPLASAEIALEGGELAAAALSFDVPSTRLAASGKWLSLVRYDAARDEWRVITPVVSIDGNRARAQIASAGAYALVYGDATARAPAPGGVLSALPDRCAVTPCAFATSSLTLDPARVLPNETTVATLVIDGRESPFPSGTAVQAWIDEELTLADGTLLLDPPFAADLILYRTLEGTDATAVFHLAPSRRAAEVILESGVDHVRLRPYPGRLARGTLVGPEGGRIPSDENVSVEIPAGATADPVRASASSLGADELASLGVVAGFRILGGLALSLERVDGASADADGDGDPDPAVPVMLGASARLTFRADASLLAPDAQVIVVEVVGDTPYGRVMRVAARTAAVPFETAAARLFTTSPIDRSVLPLDGIVREGRYLFLAAEAPIAFATGSIRRGASGPYLENALVSALPLGVKDVTRTGGLFVMPVPAAPAQPFSVVARHTAIGEGMPRVAASAPAKDAVVVLGDLLLEAQPPRVSSTVPSNGAKDVSLTSTVRVQFDRALDPESIRPDGIVVSGPAGILAGSVTSEGPSAILWSLAPGASLVPGAIYTARVSPQIRSIAGAPLGAPFSFSFAALSELSNGEVRSGLISITIPSPSGASSVQGAPGALPSGWRAVAVRRGNDFATRYQATASPNGEFILVAGGCESAPATCPDAIAITDLIDLHVTNAAGSLAAIIPLAPFVSTDRTGFIAREHEATTFTSREGIAVTVPAGAFDRPVLVTVALEQKTALADVPRLDEELQWSGSLALKLDCNVAEATADPCVAKERIQLGIPVPANFDPASRLFLLGLLGQSVRGPRIMVVDTLRIEEGRFATAPAASRATGAMASSPRVSAGVQVNADVKSSLLGAITSGIYSVVDVKLPAGSSFGWSLMDVTGGAYELFNETFASLYASSFYLTESRGRVAIPILTGVPFKITGYDAAAGLQAFEKVYDPNPLADPGAVFLEAPPIPNLHGPYPVFGTPFRVEVFEVSLENVDFAAIRNFVVRLEGGMVKVFDAPGSPLPATVPVTLLNPSNGALDPVRGDGLQVAGKGGDRIVLLVREMDADASSAVSIVFNEALFLGEATAAGAVDAFLKARFKLEHRPATAPATAPFTDATALARFGIDSQRRVTIELPAALQRGALYRLRISKELADASGLKLLEYQEGGETKGGTASDLVLEFTTRAPGGSLAEFEIRQDATTQRGSIRDLALDGNVMYVSALEGGLVAYDVSNAAGMSSTSLPLSYVAGGLDDYWSSAVDRHGRVYAAALGSTFGVIRTFRAEQFLREAGQTVPHVVQEQVGGGVVSWVPGYSSSLPASTASVLSDRPEAIPRKLQLLVQDADDPALAREAFKKTWGSLIAGVEPLAAGAERLTLSIPIEGPPGYPYLLQRVTVENVSAALRASGDARPGTPAALEIVAGPRDLLRIVRNQRTYGVVSLWGYGVGILDLNALESNDAPGKPPGWKPIQEKIALTRASIEADDSLPSTWEVGEIPDLTFSPDAAILPGGDGPNVFAVEARRGVLDLPVRPQPAADGGFALGAARGGNAGIVFRSTLGADSYDHPRLQGLRAKFKDLAGREPFGRFGTIAPYRWTLDAAQNPPVAKGSNYGLRGSAAGSAIARDYVFIAGNEYGILVVEAGGDAPLGLAHEPLSQQSLVDVIWIPAGAVSVRVVPGWHIAAVIDGLGHLLLVDVSRIDERFGSDGAPVLPATTLFPTASSALSTTGAYGVGSPDPRVLWRSEIPVAAGALAPLIDPLTGLVYAGRLLGTKLEVVAALDPRLRVLVDLGGGSGAIGTASAGGPGTGSTENVYREPARVKN